MKTLFKLFLLALCISMSFAQGKIVSVDTITKDFGEVTTEIVMSVAEFNQLINQSAQQAQNFNPFSIKRMRNFSYLNRSNKTVPLKMVGGKLIIGNSNSSRNMYNSPMTMSIEEDGFKDFNIDMINQLNAVGGDQEIHIQDRNGELVLTNGDYSYNYIDD